MRIETGTLFEELLVVGDWKTQRIRSRLRRNTAPLVEEVTAIAVSATDEVRRIEVLTLLHGVGWGGDVRSPASRARRMPSDCRLHRPDHARAGSCPLAVLLRTAAARAAGVMPPKPFLVPWSELRVADLRRFVAEPTEEPLTWEAKGDGREPLNARTVAKAAAAFANSDRGGFLVVGAVESGEAWSVTGLPHPPRGELSGWLDRVIRDGVAPIPVYDVRILRRGRNPVAVVAIGPVGTPPCITSNGVVYIGTSGSAVPVKDPAVLAGLFARGDAARASAEDRAFRAGFRLLKRPSDLDPKFVLFTIGLAATMSDFERSRRLLAPDFGQAVHRSAASLQLGEWQQRTHWPTVGRAT